MESTSRWLHNFFYGVAASRFPRPDFVRPATEMGDQHKFYSCNPLNHDFYYDDILTLRQLNQYLRSQASS